MLTLTCSIAVCQDILPVCLLLRTRYHTADSNKAFSETSNTVTGTPTAGRSPGPHGSAESQEAAERAARALLASGAHHHYEKPMAKPKWHFGIRSRSPPMEVMLEIYKTLSVLGMEWRTKEGIDLPEIGPPAPEGYPEDITAALEQWASYHGGEVPEMSRKAPGKKELAAQEKAAQGLYLVETRARYGDFMVSLHPPTNRCELAKLICVTGPHGSSAV